MLQADEFIYVQVLIAVQTRCETPTGSLPGLSRVFRQAQSHGRQSEPKPPHLLAGVAEKTVHGRAQGARTALPPEPRASLQMPNPAGNPQNTSLSIEKCLTAGNPSSSRPGSGRIRTPRWVSKIHTQSLLHNHMLLSPLLSLPLKLHLQLHSSPTCLRYKAKAFS